MIFYFKFLVFPTLIIAFLLSYKKNADDVWDIKNLPRDMDQYKILYPDSESIWKHFVKAKQEGIPTPILDYSYAGYDFGESLPPYFPSEDYQKKKEVNGLKIFNVVDYGAIPNDGREDFEAVKKAAEALQKNGSGVLFFPKGRFDMSEVIRDTAIKLKGQNFLIKGSGASKNPEKGTILTMRTRNKAKSKWEVIPLLSVEGKINEYRWRRKVIKEKLIKPVSRGTHKIYLDSVKSFKRHATKTITLRIQFPVDANNKLFKYYFEGLEPGPGWRNKFILPHTYTVDKIDEKNNIVYTKEALVEDYIDPNTNIKVSTFIRDNNGIEDVYIECGWKGRFKHDPGNTVQDGWTAIKMNSSHSWVRQCVVANASNPFSLAGFHNSIYNCLVTGNRGHNGFNLGTIGSFSAIFNARNNANSHHGIGIDGEGNIVWKYKSYRGAGPDHHAKNALGTLFDSCTLPSLDSHGGAHGHFPHHLRFLLFWNTYIPGATKVNFWNRNYWGYYVVKPSFVGLKKDGDVKITGHLGYFFNDEKVIHASIYRSQLELRIGEKAKWLDKIVEEGKIFYSEFGIH